MPIVQALTGYAGLTLLATTSVFAGSHGSLPKPKLPPAGEDAEQEEEEEVMPHITSEDAWLFPVLGSVTLGGLYLIIKYLGPDWINWLMSWYLSLASLYSVTDALLRVARNLIGPKRYRSFTQYHLKFQRGKNPLFAYSWRTPSFFLIPLGTLPTILYRLESGKKSALLTDILALSFAHEAISMMKLDSFKTGCILLSGLFLYDIWWVFGTKVMVSVATSLDVPIKLLWPKSFGDLSKGHMMLGLGDIVVPGVFVALALRYDHQRSLVHGGDGRSFPKPYFTAAVLAYVSGLATTMTVMHVFKAAQPALLYLSPACILSFVITAAARGEFKEAWSWSDETPEDKNKSEVKDQDPKKEQ
ncbi:unnamed protein product [Peniophora sp. CBMAI 1063]|nr:unnamed protein product [Peniophora sp. CBMAI 1063]